MLIHRNSYFTLLLSFRYGLEMFFSDEDKINRMKLTITKLDTKLGSKTGCQLFSLENQHY